MRLVLAAVLILLALPAVAPAQQSRILQDCRRNQGVVTGQYAVGPLRAAYKAIPRAKRAAGLSTTSPKGNQHSIIISTIFFLI